MQTFYIEPFQFENYQNTISSILEKFPDFKIWCLSGNLGAGKTTFVQQFGKVKGINSAVSSPTFSLVNEYLCSNNELVYHIDLYRLKNLEEALEIGLPDYLDSGYFCLVEWAEMFPSIFQDKHLNINIHANNDHSRLISVTPYENRN